MTIVSSNAAHSGQYMEHIYTKKNIKKKPSIKTVSGFHFTSRSFTQPMWEESLQQKLLRVWRNHIRERDCFYSQ